MGGCWIISVKVVTEIRVLIFMKCKVTNSLNNIYLCNSFGQNKFSRQNIFIFLIKYPVIIPNKLILTSFSLKPCSSSFHHTFSRQLELVLILLQRVMILEKSNSK